MTSLSRWRKMNVLTPSLPVCGARYTARLDAPFILSVRIVYTVTGCNLNQRVQCSGSYSGSFAAAQIAAIRCASDSLRRGDTHSPARGMGGFSRACFLCSRFFAAYASFLRCSSAALLPRCAQYIEQYLRLVLSGVKMTSHFSRAHLRSGNSVLGSNFSAFLRSRPLYDVL